MQIEVAQILDACENSVVSWELGKTFPALKFIPRIIGFLGYLPFSDIMNKPFAERIFILQQLRGITQEELASEFDISPDTLTRWIIGKNRPRKSIVERIDEELQTLMNRYREE